MVAPPARGPEPSSPLRVLELLGRKAESEEVAYNLFCAARIERPVKTLTIKVANHRGTNVLAIAQNRLR